MEIKLLKITNGDQDQRTVLALSVVPESVPEIDLMEQSGFKRFEGAYVLLLEFGVGADTITFNHTRWQGPVWGCAHAYIIGCWNSFYSGQVIDIADIKQALAA